MLPEVKQDSLKRLSYIEGHLAGIRRMIEDEQYCVDILKQTYAVRRAIQKVESKLLDGHLHTHVLEGVRNGHDQEVLDELVPALQPFGEVTLGPSRHREPAPAKDRPEHRGHDLRRLRVPCGKGPQGG